MKHVLETLNPNKFPCVLVSHNGKHLGYIPSHNHYLKLSENVLASLPSEFDKLTKIKYLSITNANFAELPAGICNMRELEILDLSFSGNIKKLPSCVAQFASLKQLIKFPLIMIKFTFENCFYEFCTLQEQKF